ncbi:hypothetical protein CJ026_026265 [Ralstonia pickettii]|uniref:hypothetical protein n=1 Tax=Ralstonia pickettii TaxID=329 RepID=UPI000CD4AFE5|nr:hypothetical protein CJ026_026265 [Ralstonia pickettii]
MATAISLIRRRVAALALGTGLRVGLDLAGQLHAVVPFGGREFSEFFDGYSHPIASSAAMSAAT